jgi:hypothetical protein
MATKINSKTTREALEEKFLGDAKILNDASTLLGFAAAVTSGEPLTWTAGIALILKTAGSSLSAGVNIVKRLVAIDPPETDILPKYERFRIIFYVTCQRAYIETVKDALTKLDLNLSEARDKPKLKKEEVNQLRVDLQMRVANLEEAEVSYRFGIEPLEKDVPLFDAFGLWLGTALRFYGAESTEIHKIIDFCKKESRNRFRVELAADDPSSIWMRNYLAISYREETAAQVTNDLASIRAVLEHWTDPIAQMKAQKRNAWDDYRKSLKQLPDQKETMFNEQFGVRKVFLPPQVKYHVAGTVGEAGTPKVTPDIGRVLGALISNRTSGEDLIILCGGPGSGKSTLCRVLASELANYSNVHPVFLRLRRAKEGLEVSHFIEESLQKQGVISGFADLRDVPNLILILDGFDELVMASRAKLRHFFNVLREELTTGPLRNAKAIVSGRDTLFPAGEGLPWGSHVLSLLPFDTARVKRWGKKWRDLHKTGPGSTFKPEDLLDSNGSKATSSPLHHLVSWPLTLHLVARVHTSGKLDFGGRNGREIEKAYLYRSILAETASRQFDKCNTKGGLEPQRMREFLRSLAWQMYSRSIDSMDPAEVVPLLSKFFPTYNEADFAELAEVAIVSSPELTKGEETGFEFVHKSFSEFLVAERLAEYVERIAFKANDYKGDLAWQMSDDEAVGELASVTGLRLVTEEVQEMLEPMLGCLVPFLAGNKVDEVVSGDNRRDGLSRIVERWEMLYDSYLRGVSIDVINNRTRGNPLISSPFEAYSNYCAGLLIIGTASARQLSAFKSNANQSKETYFNAEPFPGALWRCMSLLHAGGMAFDEKVAHRLFRQISVSQQDGKMPLADTDMPWKPALLRHAQGYKLSIEATTKELIKSFAALEAYAMFITSWLVISDLLPNRQLLGDSVSKDWLSHFANFRERPQLRMHYRRRESSSTIDRHVRLLIEAGICAEPFLRTDDRDYDALFEYLRDFVYQITREFKSVRPDEHSLVEARKQLIHVYRGILERVGLPQSEQEGMDHRLMLRQLERLTREVKKPLDQG